MNNTYGHPPTPNARSRGITLIELGFVVGIIAIIVVAVLTIFITVKGQQEVTDVTGDMAAIHNAVSTWASGRQLLQPGGTEDDDDTPFLTGWRQLRAFLPGDLGNRAKELTDNSEKTLSKVNSWQDGTYIINTVENQPYQFEVTITHIPDGVGETLKRRLQEAAVAVTEPRVTTNSQGGTDEDEEREEITVTYSL